MKDAQKNSTRKHNLPSKKKKGDSGTRKGAPSTKKSSSSSSSANGASSRKKRANVMAAKKSVSEVNVVSPERSTKRRKTKKPMQKKDALPEIQDVDWVSQEKCDEALRKCKPKMKIEGLDDEQKIDCLLDHYKPTSLVCGYTLLCTKFGQGMMDVGEFSKSKRNAVRVMKDTIFQVRHVKQVCEESEDLDDE